jgi:hypothetical protein
MQASPFLKGTVAGLFNCPPSHKTATVERGTNPSLVLSLSREVQAEASGCQGAYGNRRSREASGHVRQEGEEGTPSIKPFSVRSSGSVPTGSLIEEGG